MFTAYPYPSTQHRYFSFHVMQLLPPPPAAFLLSFEPQGVKRTKSDFFHNRHDSTKKLKLGQMPWDNHSAKTAL
jgi:hypothetical protein